MRFGESIKSFKEIILKFIETVIYILALTEELKIHLYLFNI